MKKVWSFGECCVTLDELEQLWFLRMELATLQEDLFEVVAGGGGVEERERLADIIAARKAQVCIAITHIERELEKVTDSEIRLIIELRYIRQQPWNVIALKLYGAPTGDRARKRVMRFLQK